MLVKFDIVTTFHEGPVEIIVVVVNPYVSKRNYSFKILSRCPRKENFSGAIALC
jgi:flagellar assembly factor FliW